MFWTAGVSGGGGRRRNLLHGWARYDRSSSPSFRESLDSAAHSRLPRRKLPAPRARCYRAPTTDFPRAILDYWHDAFDGRRVDAEGDFKLTVVPTLNRKRPAMILEGQDGLTRAALTPELAEAIGIDAAGMMTVAGLRERLTGAGVVLHDPDFLFYLAGDTAPAADRSKAPRQLTERDHAAFGTFQAERRIMISRTPMSNSITGPCLVASMATA